MEETYFVYGALCHEPLLARILGHHPQVLPAWLPGYALRTARDAEGEDLAFPLMVAAPGEAVWGVIIRLGKRDVDLLGYYETGYSATRLRVRLGDGSETEARVYLPLPGRLQPGGVWDAGVWRRDWSEIVTEAAGEYMALRGQIPAERAAARYPMILVRAASRIRARDTAPAETRFRPESGDVVVDKMTTGYAKFFAVEDYILRHRRFSGAMSAPLSRAAFVSGDASVVLPYDPVRDRVLLVEQFRSGPFARGDANPWHLEPVAGRVDPGETPEAAALREASEEAGLSISRLIAAPNFYPSPGAKSEYLYCFIGLADLHDTAARPGGIEAEGEDIRPHLMSFDQLMALVDSGEANNGPTILLALWLARLRPALRAQSADGG